MTGTDLRRGVVQIALSWLGVHELTPRHKELIDYYNELFGYRVYKMQYTDPWCAAFVSAVGMYAIEKYKLACKPYELIPASAACDPMVAEYRRLGRWVENDAYVPSPGDVILYDWQDNGQGDNKGSTDHVGIVECVSGGTITVIEGNKSNAVGRRYIALNGQFIRGYGLPDYDRWAATASQEPEETIQDGQGVIIVDDTPASASDTNVGGKKSFTIELHYLRRGDKGEEVRSMQAMLIARDCSCGPWGADGDFGIATFAALRAFQFRNGLTMDGEYGPLTASKLLGV